PRSGRMELRRKSCRHDSLCNPERLFWSDASWARPWNCGRKHSQWILQRLLPEFGLLEHSRLARLEFFQLARRRGQISIRCETGWQKSKSLSIETSPRG